MPTKDGKLTMQEAAFVGYMAATGDEKYAGHMARYKSPTSVWAKSNDPAIAAAVRKAEITRLNGKTLTLAIDLIERVILDEKEATRNRITAAQTVMKYALGGREGADAKEAHEMTPAELQARIDELRRAMADKAKPIIDVEPEPETGVFD